MLRGWGGGGRADLSLHNSLFTVWHRAAGGELSQIILLVSMKVQVIEMQLHVLESVKKRD